MFRHQKNKQLSEYEVGSSKFNQGLFWNEISQFWFNVQTDDDGGGGGSSSSIIIELQAMMTMGLTHIALHCRDQLGQSKQSRASQQGQMFCSPCQIWSQDTPFISFVTLVSKNFAAYLRFLKWKPFLAFHFPVTMGFEMLKPHNYDARVTINLDIAWLRLIQLLLVPLPPGRAVYSRGRRRTSWGSFTVWIVRRFVSHSTGLRFSG